MYKLVLALILSGALLPAGAARAEFLRGPYDYPSPIAFDAQMGLQLGMGGMTPGGLKLLISYNHRFRSSASGVVGLWFFADVAAAVGVGVGICRYNPASGMTGVYECNDVGYGSDLEVRGGVLLTFRTRYPLVPYVKMGMALAGVFPRPGCGDSGVGVPLGALGGGARYFLTRHFALALGADLHFGPSFYNGGNQSCYNDHNEFWRSLSFLLGAHYAL